MATVVLTCSNGNVRADGWNETDPKHRRRFAHAIQTTVQVCGMAVGPPGVRCIEQVGYLEAFGAQI